MDTDTQNWETARPSLGAQEATELGEKHRPDFPRALTRTQPLDFGLLATGTKRHKFLLFKPLDL